MTDWEYSAVAIYADSYEDFGPKIYVNSVIFCINLLLVQAYIL